MSKPKVKEGDKVYFIEREYNHTKFQFSIPHVACGIVTGIEHSWVVISVNHTKPFTRHLRVTDLMKSFQTAKNRAVKSAKKSFDDNNKVIQKLLKKQETLKSIHKLTTNITEKDVIG